MNSKDLAPLKDFFADLGLKAVKNIGYKKTFSKIGNIKSCARMIDIEISTQELNQRFDQVYEDMIASAEKRRLESMTMMRYDERFQVFLALGILIIFCEALISERKKV